MIYFVIILYLCVIAFLANKFKNRKVVFRFNGMKKVAFSRNPIFFILILVPMACISVMRSYSIGTDTAGVYKLIYYGGYAKNNWETPIYEGIFIQYVKALYRIIPEFDALLLVSFVLVSIAFIPYFLKNKTKINLCISLLMFFAWIFCPYLNVLRQMLAVSISFIGLKALEKNKIKMAIIVWIFSSFIHITSVVMFFYLLPYLFKDSVHKEKILVFFAISPITTIFIGDILTKISLFNKFTGNISAFKIENLNSKFFLLPVLILPLIIVFLKRILKRDEFNYLHICGYLLSFTSVMLSGYLWYAFRMIYYFIPSMTIIMGQIGGCGNKKQKSIINWYLIMSIIVSFIYVYIVKNTDEIYPYSWR